MSAEDRREDRERVLRARADRLADNLLFSGDENGRSLILAALRQTEEEARANTPRSYEGPGCEFGHDRYWMSIYGNCMACARDAARAAGEQAGRDAEREACAKLAEGHFVYGHSVAGPHFAAGLAAKIRARGSE